MKISYYPGCTLKATARNLEDSALASLAHLGIEVHELERWNCCGAVFSLASDDLLHQIAPTRILIRAMEAGSEKIVTLCSQCYNVLARANELFRGDEEKAKTLNEFMTEEPDYDGSVEVVHYLQLLHDELGWEGLREKVTKPLTDLKVAPFYGCTLLRPESVSIDAPTNPVILRDFVEALGGTAVEFPLATECCSAYQMVGNPDAGLARAQKVVASAVEHDADALILSCPLCEYNLGKLQKDFAASSDGAAPKLPVFYFSQLLALALGLEIDCCRFELNADEARALLAERNLVAAGA
jgi:heterodisulfide reductase subunit B2